MAVMRNLVLPLLLVWLEVYASNARSAGPGRGEASKRIERNARCLSILSEACSCEQDVHALVPVDRYTCNNLTAILDCYVPSIKAKCYGMRARKRMKREMLMLRDLFPEHSCKNLKVKPREALRLYKTSKYNRCDPRQELKIGIALDGCAGFLLGGDPDLVKKNPCLAIQAFKDGCIDKLLPKCFRPGSGRYRAQEVVAVANLLSYMAAENNLTLTLDTSAVGCEPLRKDFGAELLLVVRGPDLTAESDFMEDPNKAYFGQSWRPLYESVIEGNYKPPGDTNLTKDDILDFVEETLEY